MTRYVMGDNFAMDTPALCAACDKFIAPIGMDVYCAYDNIHCSSMCQRKTMQLRGKPASALYKRRRSGTLTAQSAQ